MAIDFKFFKASKKDFDTINNNPLCKIVDIDVFKENDDWLIDKYWENKSESLLFDSFDELLTFYYDERKIILNEIDDCILEIKKILNEED